MAGRRRSPHADDPGGDDGGTNSSMTPQEPEDTDGYAPAASPPSAHHSGQPGRSIFVSEQSSDGPTIGAASSSARGPDEDDDSKITDKTAAPILLGPRSSSSPMGGADSDDGDSWVGFSDRTGGGTSTSMSSPDAYDYRSFFGDPALYEAMMHEQILEHSFWRYEDEACDDTSQNGNLKIHEKEPLSSLAAEFVYDAMKDKSNMLLANYSEYRKVAGDGSCFYRSFIYSYLEQLVKASPDEELRLLGALEPILEKFQRLDWPDSYSDGHNAFVGFILECMEVKLTLSVSDYEAWLFQESQDEHKFANNDLMWACIESVEGGIENLVSTLVLSYLRLVTAIEICTEADKFRHFIPELVLENMDIVEWCRQYVIPMSQEADQVHEIALTDVLHVPLRIVNVDISETGAKRSHHLRVTFALSSSCDTPV